MVQNQLKLPRKNILLFLAALLFITGNVLAQESGDNGDTRLKVIQLSPGAGPTDVFIDGEQVADDLGFGDLTDLELETGRHQVRAVLGDTEISRTVNLRQSQPYTLTINNRAFDPGTTLIPHNTTTIQNQAKLRVAHFSPDLLAVDVELEDGSTVNTGDLNYLETGSYTTLQPGNYTVEVTETRIGGTSFERQIRVRPNTTYTAFIAGLGSGPSDQSLRIIPVTDSLKRQIENGGSGDNGKGNGDAGDDEEDTIRQDFSLVCRFEETNSD